MIARAVGIALCAYSETVTTYTYLFGTQIPSGQQTIHPAAGIGLVVVIFGICVLVVAFRKSRSARATTVPNKEAIIVIINDAVITMYIVVPIFLTSLLIKCHFSFLGR